MMKFVLAFLLSFLTTAAVFCQDSWKVFLGNKVVLNTSEEDAEKNVIPFSSADLKKSKTLVVNYDEAVSQKGWERTMMIYDEKDSELKIENGRKLLLQTSALKRLFEKSNTLKIYTVNFPADPRMKSRVRIRRVHLCTLVLQQS